jgi:hypothetical protein
VEHDARLHLHISNSGFSIKRRHNACGFIFLVNDLDLQDKTITNIFHADFFDIRDSIYGSKAERSKIKIIYNAGRSHEKCS